MISAPKPSDELERVTALYQYNILDTEPEAGFDDITHLAAYICQTPIALVGLIDKDRQWFKSKVGITSAETPRKLAFCAYTILQDEIFIVPDTLKDERFANNPLVCYPPNIRFYAGVPIKTVEGYPLGTLCVMDYRPRQLSKQQCLSLEALARQVMNIISLKKNQDTLKSNFHELQKLTRFISYQQEKIFQAARMSSLGEMANGVAHEINNPLSVIDHTVEKISRSHRMDMKSMNMIQKSIHRITTIINGLREYARDGNKDPVEVINIMSLLKTTLELYDSRAKEEGINFKLESSDTHEVEAIHTHVSQILMNLMQNAFHAIHNSDNKWISLKSYEDNDEVVIEISDSGPGIDKSLRDAIFDPFFTSREPDKGTGLGLSISRRLAENNGGSLTLDTTSATTKFTLRLKNPKKSSPEHPQGSPGQLPLAS